MLVSGGNDYQRFAFRDGSLSDIGELMANKLLSLPPDWHSGSVLDVGTDHGFWCFYALKFGASSALGLDRGRPVKGVKTDLVERNRRLAADLGIENIEFDHIDLGHQWHEFGAHDNVLMFSCYHHVYNNCMDHFPIWYWLHRRVERALWWEAPLGPNDPVVRKDVADASGYTRKNIMEAACHYFTPEFIGASAIAGREVWKFTPIQREHDWQCGEVVAGAGGAAKAFNHAEGRRISEIDRALGCMPFPGSLNVMLDEDFDWDQDYFRARIHDVVDRRLGLDSAWAPRWCRFYPVVVKHQDRSCWATVMRFEGERYSPQFLELLSATKLREALGLSGTRDPIQIKRQ